MGTLIYKMAQEIHWKSFQSHLSKSLQKLYSERKFADVTLVSEDLTQIAAHKAVLSAASPKLETILSNSSHSHPLLYMRGVETEDLQSILQFIYLGEVHVRQDRIEKILEIAQDFQIEEFMNGFSQGQVLVEADDEVVVSVKYTIEESIDKYAIEDVIKEANVEDQLYNCDSCELVYKHNAGLMHHQRTVHSAVVLFCYQCEYTTTQRGLLKMHKQSKHEGFQYSCNKCAYLATDKGDLKKHQEYKHEDAKYSCNQCESVFKHDRSLKQHHMSFHKGITFSCHLCAYQANQKGHLKRHKESKHGL